MTDAPIPNFFRRFRCRQILRAVHFTYFLGKESQVAKKSDLSTSKRNKVTVNVLKSLWLVIRYWYSNAI